MSEMGEGHRSHGFTGFPACGAPARAARLPKPPHVVRSASDHGWVRPGDRPVPAPEPWVMRTPAQRLVSVCRVGTQMVVWMVFWLTLGSDSPGVHCGSGKAGVPAERSFSDGPLPRPLAPRGVHAHPARHPRRPRPARRGSARSHRVRRDRGTHGYRLALFPDPRHSALLTAGALTALGALAAAGLCWRWRTSLAALHHTVSPPAPVTVDPPGVRWGRRCGWSGWGGGARR